MNSAGACDEDSSKTLLIVFLVIGGVGVIVVGFVIWKFCRKRQAKKMNTLLESEAQEEFEKIEN